MPITVIHADLASLRVDAIVNAASPALLGGGGVDGAIHLAAGPRLLDACRALPQVSPGVRCPTGEARITHGFALPAGHVIHTVGPVWRGGAEGEADLLRSCYRQVMLLFDEYQLQSIAFPAISCGVYDYPAEAAAKIAVATLRQAPGGSVDADIKLCGFSDDMCWILQQALNAV